MSWAANLDLVCSARVATEQWCLFNCQNYCYTGHPFLWFPMPVAECFVEELSLLVSTTEVLQPGFKHPTFRTRGKRTDQYRLSCRAVFLQEWALNNCNFQPITIKPSSHLFIKKRKQKIIHDKKNFTLKKIQQIIMKK